jgi:hypothetical protein
MNTSLGQLAACQLLPLSSIFSWNLTVSPLPFLSLGELEKKDLQSVSQESNLPV